MIIEDIVIQHHNRTINGTFYKPDGKSLVSLVIFSHGYNGYKTDFKKSAKYFANQGIGAICFTFCGGSTRCNHTFSTKQMTVFTEKEDLNAIIDEVLKWDCIKKNEIFLFGGSMGGLVSALTAEEREKDIRGLILLYPALCVADNWNDTYGDSKDIPNEVNFWGMKLGRQFIESLKGFHIFKQIGNYSKDILIMHGTKDGVVPLNYSIEAINHYGNARLEVFEKEGHGFSKDGNRRMEAMALYFIHEVLGR